MKRFSIAFALLLTGLLAACGGTPADDGTIHTTELRAGRYQCSVDVQLSGDLDPDDGDWLTFSVVNQGEGPLRLCLNEDEQNAVVVAPGESGAVTGTLGAFSKTYACQAAPMDGSPVALTYTLTQSSVSPS